MKYLDSDKSIGTKYNSGQTFKTTSIENIAECNCEVAMKLMEDPVPFFI